MGVREVKPLFESGEEMLSMREVMVLATSGLTGDGVVEGIDWIAQCIVRNIHVRQGNSDCVLFCSSAKYFVLDQSSDQKYGACPASSGPSVPYRFSAPVFLPAPAPLLK